MKGNDADADASIHESHGIHYFKDRRLDIESVALLYEDSGLKRPTKDLPRLRRMYGNSNLILSAWRGGDLVGVARSLTDFSYCCYLSDLAVKKELQKSGIGKTLIDLTRKIIGPQTTLILLSAPGAMEYYPRVGFETVHNGFIIKRES